MCPISMEEFNKGRPNPKGCPKCGSGRLEDLTSGKNRKEKCRISILHGITKYRCRDCGCHFNFMHSTKKCVIID